METPSEEIRILDSAKKPTKKFVLSPTEAKGGNGRPKDKATWATRSATGSLFRAEALSTDPAQTLKFSSSLIATVRASLIQKLEARVPDHEKLPMLFSGILKTIVRNQGDLSVNEVKIIDQFIDKVFITESIAVYGLEIYRDVLLCDNLHLKWKNANKIYIANKDAWNISNEFLSEVSVQLIEIIVRHDLMQLPKDIDFNLDDRGIAINRLAKLIAEESTS
jgi:hypothetical protein